MVLRIRRTALTPDAIYTFPAVNFMPQVAECLCMWQDRPWLQSVKAYSEPLAETCLAQEFAASNDRISCRRWLTLVERLRSSRRAHKTQRVHTLPITIRIAPHSKLHPPQPPVQPLRPTVLLQGKKKTSLRSHSLFHAVAASINLAAAPDPRLSGSTKSLSKTATSVSGCCERHSFTATSSSLAVPMATWPMIMPSEVVATKACSSVAKARNDVALEVPWMGYLSRL